MLSSVHSKTSSLLESINRVHKRVHHLLGVMINLYESWRLRKDCEAYLNSHTLDIFTQGKSLLSVIGSSEASASTDHFQSPSLGRARASRNHFF